MPLTLSTNFSSNIVCVGEVGNVAEVKSVMENHKKRSLLEVMTHKSHTKGCGFYKKKLLMENFLSLLL